LYQGCPKDYNEFVVYENRRAMIEYIIFFNENIGAMPALQAMVTARPPTATAVAIGDANRETNTVETITGADNSNDSLGKYCVCQPTGK